LTFIGFRRRLMMTFWEGFAKYVGISGVIAVMLVGGYLAAIFLQVPLPTGFEQIMLLIIGYYFGKNGRNVAMAAVNMVRGR